MQLQPTGLQGWPTVIGDGGTYRRAVSPDGVGLSVASAFYLPFNRPDVANALLEFFLGVTIRFIDGPRRLAKVVKMSPLMGDPRQGAGHRLANGTLAIGNRAHDGYGQIALDFPDQSRQVALGTAEQTAG